MKRKFSRLTVIAGLVFLFGGSAAAQEKQIFECPEAVFVGVKNVPAGWQAGFGDKRLKFEEAFIAGQSMNCSFGSTQESNFVLQRQFPTGFVCRVDEMTNKKFLNRKFSCTRTKPPIKIPKKNN